MSTMDWCNRYTIGIIIGSACILGSIVKAGLVIHDYFEQSARHEDNSYNAVRILIICITMGVSSALFVYGIVKKRHTLILPWLVISVFIIYLTCTFTIVFVYASALFGSLVYAGLQLLKCIIVVGLESAILWLSFWLYRNIRDNNNEEAASATVVYHGESDGALV